MQHTKPKRTYYVKYGVIPLILLGGLSVWIFWNMLTQQRIQDLAGIFLLFLCLFMIFTVGQTRIVTSPSGISYHNSGLYTIHSTWENIESVSLVEMRGLGQRRCIVLKQGVQLGWWSGLAFGLSMQNRGRTIPLLTKRSWSQFDRLINDLKTYAPDVTGLD